MKYIIKVDNKYLTRMNSDGTNLCTGDIKDAIVVNNPVTVKKILQNKGYMVSIEIKGGGR